MINKILILFLLTFFPALELRASIPYGLLFSNIPWFWVFLICVVFNIILGILVFILLDLIFNLIRKIKLIDKFFEKYIDKIDKKIKKYAELYENLALMIFIAIPLPGSGVYSGAIAAKILNFDFKKYVLFMSLGVLIAGIVVTAIVLSGQTIATNENLINIVISWFN